MDPRQHYFVRVDLFCFQNISSLWELHTLLRTWKSSLSLAFPVLFAKPMACIYIFLFHALLSVGLYWYEASFLADWMWIAIISLHAHAFDMLGDCCRNPGAVYPCTCGLTACNAIWWQSACDFLWGRHTYICFQENRTPDNVRSIVAVHRCQQSIVSYLFAKIWQQSIVS